MQNITFNFTKTIVVTDGDNNNEIICVIIAKDSKKTIAAILFRALSVIKH